MYPLVDNINKDAPGKKIKNQFSSRYLLFIQNFRNYNNMKTERNIGLLLITGAIGVLIPYTLLTITFEYPDVLRQDPGTILTKFHAGGSSLIFTWWAFAG